NDVARRATMALKRDGDLIVRLGGGARTLGASEYLYRVHGIEGGSPPTLDLDQEAAVQAVVRELIATGLCDTAHDVSVGGLAVAVAEMAIAGGRGAAVEVPSDDGAGGRRSDEALFGEASATVLVAVEPQ